MKSKTIDYINIFLLIISFVVAVYLPFELFLFSYAFLGPLHYLTEINWLDDKKYFLKSRSQNYGAFLLFAIIIAAFPLFKYLESINSLKNFINYFHPNKSTILLLSGFIFSVSVIYIQKTKHLILAFFLSILFSIACSLYIPKSLIAIGLFLPTLIHVYVFTILFMIYGQLRGKSTPGLIGISLLLISPFLIFFLDLESSTYSISEYIKEAYSGSGFLTLNKGVAYIFNNFEKEKFYILSPIGMKIQTFIAFAYTYHYLNWFSKTSIIGWKKSITSKRMKYILVLWLSAVGIYLYDYVTGLIALFFLSLLHVVLEFPLNVTTIKELFLASIKKVKRF